MLLGERSPCILHALQFWHQSSEVGFSEVISSLNECIGDLSLAEKEQAVLKRDAIEIRRWAERLIEHCTYRFETVSLCLGFHSGCSKSLLKTIDHLFHHLDDGDSR